MEPGVDLDEEGPWSLGSFVVTEMNRSKAHN